MATELGKAYVQIVPSARGLSGAIQGQLDPEAEAAGQSAGSRIGTGLKIAAVAAVAAVGATLGKAISSSLTEGANLQQSLGGIETLFKGSADKVIKYADQAYKTAGLSANDYMESVTSFSASLLQSLGGDTEAAADTANMALIDMSDNANKMGTSMQDIQNAYQGFAKQNYTMLDNLKLGYGGTKTEMERLLADAEKLTGVKYDINNLADVYNAIHAIQGELDITGTTAKESAETFSGALASMKAAFSNVLGNLSLGRDIAPSLQALAETTSTFLFQNFFPMVGNILKTLPSAIATFIRESIPYAQEAFSELFSSFGGSTPVFDGLADSMEKVRLIWDSFKAFSGLFGGYKGDIIGLRDAFTEMMPRSLWKEIATLSEHFGDMVREFSTGMQQVGTDLVGLGSAVVGGWTNIFANLTPVVVQTLGTVLSQIPALLSTIINAVTPIVEKVGEAITQLDFSGIQAFAAAVIPAITAAFETMMAIVAPAIDQLIESFVNMWNAAQPFISALAELLMPVLQVVASFLGGVFKGVLMGVSAVFDMIAVAVQFLTPVVEFLVGVFQACLPVFQTIAEWVGVVIGLFANLGSVGGGLSGMLSSAWTNIQTAISTAGTIISSVINGIKTFFSSLGNAGSILSGLISSVWGVIQSVISAAGNIIQGVLTAVGSGFSGMGNVVSSVGSQITGIIDGVKNVFNSLKNIDISGAGRAIMDGFLGGLKAAWGAVTDFVGGIADWIAKNKGPISYDKKLLIPAGNAIMDGLNKGLQDQFKVVKSTVSDMANELVDSFSISEPVVSGLLSDDLSSFGNIETQRNIMYDISKGFDRNGVSPVDPKAVEKQPLEIKVPVYLYPNAPKEIGYATAPYVLESNENRSYIVSAVRGGT
ncbi:phage tail protein [Enterococcus sp. BWM-S5]|uniref:Phage tail protein n=1 Tax=Enterococcus larvae TaxID=2794352 RepID=A0ABS4CIU8_9ENTE|nr:phage tail protein [Enterococcus larvae]MBP1046399.1 phage tail protein [Enterococcus larvae]